MKTVLGGLLLCWAASSAEAPSRFAKLDGHRVHYKVYGSGAQTVVLIHGWTCDLTFWREQIPALSASRRVIAIDLPGHGRSDKPEIAYTQHLFASAVDAVMRDAGVSKAVLIGHSMGGPVIRQYWRKYPAKTEALVFVDALFRRLPDSEAEQEKMRAAVAERLAAYRKPDYRETTGRAIDGMFVASTPPALREEIKAKMLSAPPYVMASAQEGMWATEIWREDIADVPALVVLAKRPFTPRDYEAYIGRLLPRVEYHEWDGAGHFLMMEDPARFNKIVADFLDRLSSR